MVLLLCNDVRFPSREEWDPHYKKTEQGLIDEVKSALTFRASPLLSTHHPKNRSIVGWSLEFPLLYWTNYLPGGYPLWAGTFTNVFHVLFFPIYYFVLLPATLVVYVLYAPIWHACIVSGSYLVWRELVALPRRRRLLASFHLHVTATAVPSDRRPEVPVLRFNLPVSDPGNCKESRPILDDVVPSKRLQMETHAFCGKSNDGKYASYLDPDETVDLVIQTPQVPFQMCNVMSAKACNELQERVRFVPSKCILSVLLGGLIMAVGGGLFFATVVLPTKYGFAFYEACVGDQAFASFLTSFLKSSIFISGGCMESFVAAGAVFQAMAAITVVRKLAGQQAEGIEIAEECYKR